MLMGSGVMNMAACQNKLHGHHHGDGVNETDAERLAFMLLNNGHRLSHDHIKRSKLNIPAFHFRLLKAGEIEAELTRFILSGPFPGLSGSIQTDESGAKWISV